jgi:hypothetical protein
LNSNECDSECDKYRLMMTNEKLRKLIYCVLCLFVDKHSSDIIIIAIIVINISGLKRTIIALERVNQRKRYMAQNKAPEEGKEANDSGLRNKRTGHQ